MYIYKITNLINGKIYIGQTIFTIQKRFKSHKNDAVSGSEYAIHRAIRKYGIEHFKIEKLCKCSMIKTLNELEIFFIKKFDSKNPKIGYNMTDGGNGGSPTKEVKQKISKKLKGRFGGDKNPNYQNYWTDEQRKDLSEKRKGCISPRKGVELTDETKEILRIKAKQRWKDGVYDNLEMFKKKK